MAAPCPLLGGGITDDTLLNIARFLPTAMDLLCLKLTNSRFACGQRKTRLRLPMYSCTNFIMLTLRGNPARPYLCYPLATLTTQTRLFGHSRISPPSRLPSKPGQRYVPT